MAVTKRVRFEVFRRDNFTCRYCHATDKELTIDHVVPQALGGSDNPDNLVACCKDCNSGKTSINPDESLVSDVQERALAFRDALRAAINMVNTSVESETDYFNTVTDLWEDITSISETQCFMRPKTWKSTIRYWYSLGVPYGIIKYAFTIVSEKVRARTLPESYAFRYSKGIIGNKMEEATQLARQRIEEEKEEDAEIKHCWHCQHCWEYSDELAAEPDTPDRKDCELYYPEDKTRPLTCHICNDPNCVYVIGLIAGADTYKALHKKQQESENKENG